MVDSIVHALVLSDLATLRGKRVPDDARVSAAKGLSSFETTRTRLQATLDSLGTSVWRRNRLMRLGLPALIAAMVEQETAHLPSPPLAWRREAGSFLNRYVHAREPFSLNLVTLGLNTCQFRLFGRQSVPGPIL